ncbi:MAG: SAM-dependent methyltransferase [Rhodospirillales bacterium]|nr:SAM-dependent methyltransferase [Rhodospirillales bacterium]
MQEGLIKALIRDNGPISVERFMAMAISAYYAKGTAFGRQGDFTTAPEISQVFGELIGVWCCLVWESLGRPAPFHLVELGPGRGTLMADLLRSSTIMPGFLTSARLHLVETSPALRAQQAETLKPHAPIWHETLRSVPMDAPLIVVANEFLDALPIRQYVRKSGAWFERLVGLAKNGALEFQTADEAEAILSQPGFLRNVPDGAVWETNPQALALVDDLSSRLRLQGGGALFIDYGPLESGLGDSLQAVKGHAFTPVLAEPGLADLTAHVDFAALARRARESGLKDWGPVPQGVWLQRLGIAPRTSQLAATASQDRRDLLVSASRRLIDPQEMGTLFKVLALAAPCLSLPPGFEVT